MSIEAYDAGYVDGKGAERLRILELVQRADATLQHMVSNGHEEYEIASAVLHLMILPGLTNEETKG